jgi:hypothetical protein
MRQLLCLAVSLSLFTPACAEVQDERQDDVAVSDDAIYTIDPFRPVMCIYDQPNYQGAQHCFTRHDVGVWLDLANYPRGGACSLYSCFQGTWDHAVRSFWTSGVYHGFRNFEAEIPTASSKSYWLGSWSEPPWLYRYLLLTAH